MFFDNIYMYDKDHLNGITEATPINPPSKKGVVRAEIAKMIWDEVEAGKINRINCTFGRFLRAGHPKHKHVYRTYFKTLQ